MADHITNRDALLQALRQELVGPHPIGEEIDCAAAIRLDDVEAAYRPYRQLGSGEEILQRDSPTKRYGVGVLYPMEVPDAPEDLQAQQPPPEDDLTVPQPENARETLTTSAVHDCEEIAARVEQRLSDADTDDFDLSSANAYKPSSMAVSLLVHLPDGAELVITATGGRYAIKEVLLSGREREWWLRSPVRLIGRFRRADFPAPNARYVEAHEPIRENVENLDVRIELFARPQSRPDEFLITACLVNRQQANGRLDHQSLFQCRIDIKLESGSSSSILPYPTADPLDSEERSQELLYRDKLTFAVGHGCAADWRRSGAPTAAESVSAECLPVFETPSTTPDIRCSSGRPLVAPVRSLAGIDAGSNGFDQLEGIVGEYETWIGFQRSRIAGLDSRLQETAEAHMRQCSEAAQRMRDGLSLLRSDPQVRRAFELANLAMLTQQVRSRREARTASFDQDTSTLFFAEPYEALDLNSSRAQASHWRAFQIAFILASLRSTADASDAERERVELIWFPTGGGKTEAYLGLAAFSIFLRRLRNPADTGMQALMRYTLRLLTAQQFQRASRLVCAMEYIRRHNAADLGDAEISIGIWLGGSTTPNSRADALAVFRSLTRGTARSKTSSFSTAAPGAGPKWDQ